MDFRLLHLIATVIDACDQRPSRGPGHPPSETIRVVATLRRFLREGTPWRSLSATPGQASGATLRRCLRRWAERGLLAKVHALLVGMLRGHHDLILDTCLVRAKRGGDLTGPNPTDRGKRGTKYHIATDGDGVPVACLATAANVNDTLAFERLFLAAFAVMARIRTVFADKGYDAEHHRDLCRAFDTAGEFPLSSFCHQCSEFRASCRCQIGATEPFGHPDQVHRCRSRDVLEVGLGLTDIT